MLGDGDQMQEATTALQYIQQVFAELTTALHMEKGERRAKPSADIIWDAVNVGGGDVAGAK